MKPAHLMTLEEYRENVSPLIVEFKAILRKKFLFDCTFNEWKYVTYEEYKSEAMQECEQRVNELMAQVVAMEKETGKPHPNPNLRVELMQNGIDSIEERIEKEQIKRTTMPVEMRSRAKEILQELSERFTINARFDLKALEKTHKPVIRHALESDSYISLLLTDELSHDQLEKICASVDIKIPKRIYQFKSMNTDYHRDALLPFNRAFYDSLIPDWQRESVWTLEQKVSFIESCYLGYDLGSVVVNGYQELGNNTLALYSDCLIDGQQRVEAMLDYTSDKFKVFGLLYSELERNEKTRFLMRQMGKRTTHCFDLNKLKAVYNHLNFSGTNHLESERA